LALNRQKVLASAQKYIERGQLDKAIHELGQLSAEDPTDMPVLMHMATLYVNKGERARAVGIYLRVAEFYLAQGFYTKAIAVYKHIFKNNPDRIEIAIKLADLYTQLGFIGEGLAHYKQAVTYFEKTGESAKTLKIQRKIVDLDRDDVAACLKLGDLYANQNMISDAQLAYRHALEKLQQRDAQNPEDRLLLEQLAKNFSALGEESQAQSSLQELGKFAQVHEIEITDLETNENELAVDIEVEYAQPTIDVDDDLQEAGFLETQGLASEAIDAYKNILTIVPDHPVATQRLQALTRILDAGTKSPFDLDEIFSAFKKGVATTVSDHDYAAHYDLGIAYHEMDLIDDAVGEFEKAAQSPDKEVDAWTMIGLCRLSQDDSFGAVEAFRRALQSPSCTPEQALAVRYEMAQACEKLGDHSQAQSLFSQVFQINPTYREVAQKHVPIK